MYRILFVPKAEKELKKLEKKEQAKILAVLDRICINPHKYAKKLVGYTGYRFRSGNYRILVDIIDKDLIVLILKIQHRKNIYNEL